MGSFDCPDHDAYESEEEYSRDAKKWGESFSAMGRTVVTGFVVGEVMPDLVVHFASGHRLETFGNSGADYWWYFSDTASGEMYEASAAGVTYGSRGGASPERDGAT